MKVAAVYFDLDDTLCGYWDASKAALRTAFERHGPKHLTADDLVQHWATAFRQFSPTLKTTGWYPTYLRIGEPTRTEQMRLALIEAGIEDLEMAKALSLAYGAERDRNLKLFEEAREVLDALKGRYPLGLITNGPADIQRQEIATLGIESYFDHIFIEGEMGEGKPLQAVFLRAQRAVELEPGEIMFVGNSYAHDIQPAIEAGWQTAWIIRPSDVAPSRNYPEGKPEGAPEPTLTITDLRELLPALLP